MQLYTIHGVAYGSVQPLVWALLPHKNEETYRQMLQAVVRLRADCMPQRIMMDFELASINAFMHQFPQAQLSGCFFHFMQANWRHVQQLGGDVVRRYSEDAQYAVVCKLLPSLAFVPRNEVAQKFDEIARFLEEHHPELQDFVDYFEFNYIGLPNRNAAPGRRQARFPIQLWNMYERATLEQARSNNTVEGWHRGLAATLGVTNPTVWRFLDAMRFHFRAQERDLEQFGGWRSAKSFPIVAMFAR